MSYVALSSLKCALCCLYSFESYPAPPGFHWAASYAAPSPLNLIPRHPFLAQPRPAPPNSLLVAHCTIWSSLEYPPPYAASLPPYLQATPRHATPRGARFSAYTLCGPVCFCPFLTLSHFSSRPNPIRSLISSNYTLYPIFSRPRPVPPDFLPATPCAAPFPFGRSPHCRTLFGLCPALPSGLQAAPLHSPWTRSPLSKHHPMSFRPLPTTPNFL